MTLAPPAEFLILGAAMLAAGAAGGVLAGLLGVGGGIVIVPVLEATLALLGVDAQVRMHVAVGTSLATIIPTSIASTRAHLKRESVDVALARSWGPWILLGALAGTFVAGRVESRVLTGVFGAVSLLVAIKMLLPLDRRTVARRVPRGGAAAPLPATIGCVSSMMGIGGGTLSVPILTLCAAPIHRAVGTSALFGLLIAVPGTVGFMLSGAGNPLLPVASAGYVNLIGFALIVPATVACAPLGAAIAHGLSRRWLSFAFGMFLLLVAARMLWQTDLI